MHYLTDETGKVCQLGSTSFETNSKKSTEIPPTKKGEDPIKVNIGYMLKNGVFTPPDTTDKENERKAWNWAKKNLYDSTLSSGAKWVKAIEHPHLKEFMSEKDRADLIQAWKTATGV